jgi:hypothetical protein
MSITQFTDNSITKTLRQAAYWIDHHPDSTIVSITCEHNPDNSWYTYIRHTENLANTTVGNEDDPVYHSIHNFVAHTTLPSKINTKILHIWQVLALDFRVSVVYHKSSNTLEFIIKKDRQILKYSVSIDNLDQPDYAPYILPDMFEKLRNLTKGNAK